MLFVPKLQVALHACHAAVPVLTWQLRPDTEHSADAGQVSSCTSCSTYLQQEDGGHCWQPSLSASLCCLSSKLTVYHYPLYALFVSASSLYWAAFPRLVNLINAPLKEHYTRRQAMSHFSDDWYICQSFLQRYICLIFSWSLWWYSHESCIWPFDVCPRLSAPEG
jgi:hypothetical protein